MLSNNRGIVHTFEALLAATLILSALYGSVLFPSDRGGGRALSSSTGPLEALISLDSDGTLGSLLQHRDWDSLEEYLRIALPRGRFEVTVYDEGGTLLNDQAISNGGLIGSRIVAVDYICVPTDSRISFYLVRVQVG